jgi:hypothetical protein
MTHQELFNQVYLGLASQGFKKSGKISDGDIYCLYRGPSGRKCAAGWVIPDDEYDPRMDTEGLNGNSIGIKTLLGKDYCPLSIKLIEIEPEIMASLCALQELHDGSKTPCGMASELLQYAHTHLLTVPKVAAQ